MVREIWRPPERDAPTVRRARQPDDGRGARAARLRARLRARRGAHASGTRRGAPTATSSAGYGTPPLGHNHPEVRRRGRRGARARACRSSCRSRPAARCGAGGAARPPRPGRSRRSPIFMSSGSEAVDGALKLARAATRRPRVRVGASARSTASPSGRCRSPATPSTGRRSSRSAGRGAGAVGRRRRDRARAPRRDVAAVILETIQGEGGFRPPPPG